MMPQPRVWTCGAGLLEALAVQVLAGFPLASPAGQDLSRWTILVPTRRAARALERRLFSLSGSTAMLLPRVRPIGDADEDLLADAFPAEPVPDAVSPMGQLFLLLGLIDEWAEAHPHLALAAEVRASRSQSLGLALSLAELVMQLQTEEKDVDFAGVFSELDLAEHRLTILSLLGLVNEQLPKRLHARDLLGPAARRNLLIRLEARRIAQDPGSGPIIAAGSTGTNPATRDLLKAIADHPQGAVILPGLDGTLDAPSWEQAGPNHPQHALKILLAHLDVDRAHVRDLCETSPRMILAREVMRPAGTTEQWADPALLPRSAVDAARAGLRLIEAPDRQIEARSVALLLREVLETPDRTAALVTPDRDLAQMVTADVARWSAAVDDSGGEPLIRFGRAQLCKLLIDCVEQDFSPAALVALLSHPHVTLGCAPDEARRLAQLFELALLRQDLPPAGPGQFTATLAQVQHLTTLDRHAPRYLQQPGDAGWQALGQFAARFSAALQPLVRAPAADLAGHVQLVMASLAMLAPQPDATPSGQLFADVMEALQQESPHHPHGSLARALVSMVWALRQETLRPQRPDATRLAIFGLAEARMIEADLVVMAGLNETIWPAAADPGPWINRAMRDSLGLSQPERSIGQTAHDLAQGLLHRNVVLSWSRRAGTAPLMPSRWILRLRALLEKSEIPPQQQLDVTVPALARLLDTPVSASSLAMPCPAPPVDLRPVSFSVTEIEKLIRDPYAIFARRVLALQPLDPLGGTADHALRGTLFHEALRRFVQDSGETAEQLIEAGRVVFTPYMNHPEVQHFWWPRFRRMALAFAEEDALLRQDIVARVVERRGSAVFTIAGREHTLRAQADRIDVTTTGKARFIDYKTGAIPTARQVEAGLNPQLTLEAAILRHGTFEGLEATDTDDLLYIRAGGGRPPVEVLSLAEKLTATDVVSLSELHFAGLKSLLSQYQAAGQGYVPRAVMHKEGDASDFDHLSRFAEWSRSGE